MISHAPHTVFCLGSSGLAREVSNLIGAKVRVRWAANFETLRRSLAADAHDVAACLLEVNPEVAAVCDLISGLAPKVRRVAVAEMDHMSLVRTLLESQAANELLYRPLDAVSLLAAVQANRSAKLSTDVAPRRSSPVAELRA